MAKSKETTKPKPKITASKPNTAIKTKTQSEKSNKVVKSDNSISCSFCKKPSDNARRIFVAPTNVSICDECLDVCNRILFQDDKEYWGIQLLKIIELGLKNELVSVEVKAENS